MKRSQVRPATKAMDTTRPRPRPFLRPSRRGSSRNARRTVNDTRQHLPKLTTSLALVVALTGPPLFILLLKQLFGQSQAWQEVLSVYADWT